MPNSGRRKQRYVFDIDDVVRDGFMTKANAEALIRGLNGSGGTVKLSVPLGGTNNGTFVDQELLKYDAATGKIVSSGFTSGGGGGSGTVFVPWETGAFFSQSGLDTISHSLSDITIADQTFSLPANSLWSELEVMYGFKLPAGGTASNLQVRLQSEIMPSSEILQPDPSLVYSVATSPDTAGYTWIAKGTIPATMNDHSMMQVRIVGRPDDVPAQRTLITRLSYRGATPAPSGGAPKGIPVFFVAPMLVFSSTTGTGTNFVTYDVTSLVPDGASALILSAKIASSQQGGNIYHEIFVRPSAGSYEQRLAVVRTHSDDDEDSVVNQALVPFNTTGSTRSFQYRVSTNPNEGAEILLLGYIT